MNNQLRLFDQERLAEVQKDKRAVRNQGSALLSISWDNATCRRCGHLCGTNHRAGKMGKCAQWACNCRWCIVVCTCGHDHTDHEPYGDERTTGCGRCGCAKFAPTPSNPTPRQETSK